jgi:hypothetical protein
MNDIVRKYRDGRPSLAQYLDRPEAYPRISAPYPNYQPFPPSRGEPMDLAAALAEEGDPLGPPSALSNLSDPRLRTTAMSAVAMPQGAAPPQPFAPEPPPERRGLEPAGATAAPGTDLDAIWRESLARAQRSIQRDTGYGMESPASRWARLGPRPGEPPAPAPSPPQALLANLARGLQGSPFARFVNERGAPGIARRQAQSRARIPPR